MSSITTMLCRWRYTYSGVDEMNREEAIEKIKENRWKIENHRLRYAMRPGSLKSFSKKVQDLCLKNAILISKFQLKPEELKEKKVEVEMRG